MVVEKYCICLGDFSWERQRKLWPLFENGTYEFPGKFIKKVLYVFNFVKRADNHYILKTI